MVVHLFLNNNKALDFLPINSIKNGGITESANHYAKLIERESQDIKYFNNIYLDILNKYYLEYAFPPPNLELGLDFPEPQLSFRG